MRFDDWNNDELYHHGIKGQKWGIRRFQNPDGSLTAEGKSRYGGEKDYSKGNSKFETAVRRFATNRALFGRYKGMNGGDYREHRLERKLQKLDSSKNTSEKIESKKQNIRNKLEAQKAANLNAKAYENHTKTGKLFAQDFLFGPLGAINYRAARARGEQQGRAIVEGLFEKLPLTTTILRYMGEKQAYGRAVRHSDA